MKKKLLIGLIALMTISGTAYAAVNGTYKGRDIVSVLVNGKKVTSAVPGQLIDGATMLPLKAIAETLGARVDWDNIKKQASITTAQIPMQQPAQGLTLTQLNKVGESVGLVYQLDAQGKQIGTGSAFVVDGIAVTNWHVADGNAVSLMIDFGSSIQTVAIKDAVFKNESADLIGFKVNGVAGLQLNTADPKNKAKVYALGFPNRKFTITEGMFVSKWNDDRWDHSAKTGSGASGGALINDKGEVIGVTTESNDGGINIAVRASILALELNK